MISGRLRCPTCNSAIELDITICDFPFSVTRTSLAKSSSSRYRLTVVFSPLLILSNVPCRTLMIVTNSFHCVPRSNVRRTIYRATPHIFQLLIVLSKYLMMSSFPSAWLKVAARWVVARETPTYKYLLMIFKEQFSNAVSMS